MKKLIIIITLVVIAIIAFIYTFWPQERAITTKFFVNESGITDKNFMQFIKENPRVSVFYFCSKNNDNCDYINNTVLKNLAENLLVTELDFIYYVDLSAASTTAAAKFNRQWGFTQYPAFAIIDSSVDPYVIVSSLGFVHETPFNSDDVKNWLIKNNIWQELPQIKNH